MERETKKIVTPLGGNNIVLKAWLTGRERRDIRSALLEDVNFTQSADDEKEASPEFNVSGATLERTQDKTLLTVIVSIDDVTENILATVLDMRDSDFEFIVKEIDEITGGLDDESKKK